MKTLHSHQRQNGFFDFGLGLLLLAVFSTTAAVITQDREQELEQVVVSYSDQAQAQE